MVRGIVVIFACAKKVVEGRRTNTDPHGVNSLLYHALHLGFDVIDELVAIDWTNLRLHQQVILKHTHTHMHTHTG